MKRNDREVHHILACKDAALDNGFIQDDPLAPAPPLACTVCGCLVSITRWEIHRVFCRAYKSQRITTGPKRRE